MRKLPMNLHCVHITVLWIKTQTSLGIEQMNVQNMKGHKYALSNSFPNPGCNFIFSPVEDTAY